MIEVVVRVEVRPTESEEAVRKAVENLFSVKWVRREKVGDVVYLEGRGTGAKSLAKLHHALRKQRILDAARSYLLKGMGVDHIRFYLNKQAAAVGVASFCSYEYGESPLGAITAIVRASDLESLIDWLAPQTVEGKPVKEVGAPDP